MVCIRNTNNFSDFYFTHSYIVKDNFSKTTIAETEYDLKFSSAEAILFKPLFELANIDEKEENFIDFLLNRILPKESYHIVKQSFNSDERRGDSVNASETTGDRPTVEVLSPNGAEIWSVGDNYPVEVITTDKQYIDNIDGFLYI